MGLGIKEIIGDKREAILSLAAQYGIQNVRLFGSVLRGEADETSDIDLLVSLENSNWDRYLDFCDKAEELLKRKVDVVSDRGLDRYIGPYILKEAVLLQ